MMKNLKFIFFVSIIFAFTANFYAQTVTVTGKVTDSKNEPIVGANVSTSTKNGLTVGTVTDFDGNYEMTVNQASPFEIKVSYVGFSPAVKTVENVTSGKVTLDFTLANDALGLDEVVVTGVVNNGTKLASSVSVTTLKAKMMEQSAPRSTAEIFRAIPGIRSEASGGDGNTNIAVRGVPISSGGSKYLQLQEDGLPVFLFGDIAFATADIFLRADQNVARIEAIRGGSASTLASNSPAGIINLISKTGATEGGSIASTFGLDYGTMRTDFEYGSPIGNGLSMHVGGFFRTGEGIRSAGYNDNIGGQIKANLTKQFENGYARVYVKYLNDRTSAYMPMPMYVSGTNSNPKWGSVENYNALKGGLQSVFLQSDFGLGSDGERRRVDVADGMHPQSLGVGAEFSFDLGDDWNVENRSRYTQNSGRFVAPFTANVGSTNSILAGVASAKGWDLTGATLTLAHSGAAFNGSLAQVITLFDTELNNFDNLFSDTKISKSFDEFKLSGGLFKAYQNINMSWLWNNYLMEVRGEDAAMIDITSSGGTKLTEDGQFSYGVPVWGNCCQRQYDAKYDITAPYFSASYTGKNLAVDASLRYDQGKVRGVGFGGKQGTVDVNNDGVIQPIENSVSVVDVSQKNPISYDYDYWSYSLGGNYQYADHASAFIRYSHGASAKGDRAIDPNAALLEMKSPKDMLDQTELGWKSKFEKGGLYITGFYAKTTEEGGFEATTQKVIENDYSAYGVELEGAFAFGDFDVRGAVTYTKAKIDSGDFKGNTPRRQPTVMFNFIPSYSYGKHAIGLSFIGQSKAFAQDVNKLVMPGYVMTNAFLDLNIAKGLGFSINGNNLLNSIGITESEEGAITDDTVNYVRARSITGRSVSASLRYNF